MTTVIMITSLIALIALGYGILNTMLISITYPVCDAQPLHRIYVDLDAQCNRFYRAGYYAMTCTNHDFPNMVEIEVLADELDDEYNRELQSLIASCR